MNAHFLPILVLVRLLLDGADLERQLVDLFVSSPQLRKVRMVGVSVLQQAL